MMLRDNADVIARLYRTTQYVCPTFPLMCSRHKPPRPSCVTPLCSTTIRCFQSAHQVFFRRQHASPRFNSPPKPVLIPTLAFLSSRLPHNLARHGLQLRLIQWMTEICYTVSLRRRRARSSATTWGWEDDTMYCAAQKAVCPVRKEVAYVHQNWKMWLRV